MQIVRNSIYELWKNLVRSVKAEDLIDYVDKTGLNEKQQEYIEKKIWGFMTDCSVPDKLPDRQGRAFWLAWGHCKIKHQDIAARLTKQLRQEGKNIEGGHLTNKDIKGYLFEVREKIYERVRNESTHWNWQRHIKRYENGD